jgi:hypothetical protein
MLIEYDSVAVPDPTTGPILINPLLPSKSQDPPAAFVKVTPPIIVPLLPLPVRSLIVDPVPPYDVGVAASR